MIYRLRVYAGGSSIFVRPLSFLSSHYYDDLDYYPSNASALAYRDASARYGRERGRSGRRRRLKQPKNSNEDVRDVSCIGVPFERVPGKKIKWLESIITKKLTA